ncbi:MAG TPA: hypothetical protein VKM55_15475 [Candidatus Lokiarchaeia archaeon]|nr:hypothetical protein [Candidatus Lokiarchaeia archaeon]
MNRKFHIKTLNNNRPPRAVHVQRPEIALVDEQERGAEKLSP